MKTSNGKLGAASAMVIGGALGALIASLESYYILVVIILLIATFVIPDKYWEALENKIKNL